MKTHKKQNGPVMEPHLSRYVCGPYCYSVKLPFSTNEQF